MATWQLAVMVGVALNCGANRFTAFCGATGQGKDYRAKSAFSFGVMTTSTISGITLCRLMPSGSTTFGCNVCVPVISPDKVQYGKDVILG